MYDENKAFILSPQTKTSSFYLSSEFSQRAAFRGSFLHTGHNFSDKSILHEVSFDRTFFCHTNVAVSTRQLLQRRHFKCSVTAACNLPHLEVCRGFLLKARSFIKKVSSLNAE